MDRRKLLALSASAAAGVAISGCKPSAETALTPQPADQKVKWNLITSWPKHFPGLGSAPERLAKQVAILTNNQFQIKVLGAGELAPALEVFDAVSRGSAPMGHSAAYYWKGKSLHHLFSPVFPLV